ncbi:hypothetical protein IT882_06985 [Microbacterium schleiferi]|uniref:DUF2076 domain-containing protein n=1 Tax=Microbacterium schleiferi TaxID=69362 RepID=A0A7S8MYV9_9MICO|nr:hypothetical protein [Microbacterium schleiferi]QPE05720.1 hypothetical protein IT882_06985 [Microbacterium schleiferi]
MGFLDRLFGTEPQNPRPSQPYGQQPAPPRPAGYPSTTPPQSEDERAIERYRYLLRTAPPETIEQVHAEAFSKLTEQQRQQVLADMTASLPASERPRSADPNDMARAATRAEYMNPGAMERTLGGQRQGPSFGSMVGSSLLGTVAGYVIGSALVSAFMAPMVAADAGATDAGPADAGTGPDQGWADASGPADGGFSDGGFGGFGDFGF